MNTFISDNPDIVILYALLAAVVIVLFITRKLEKTDRKRKEVALSERVKRLEEEIDEYMGRSQRRLEIFRKVIDGFDHIIQGVKGSLAEGDLDEVERLKKNRPADAVTQDEPKDADVIRIDKTFHGE